MPSRTLDVQRNISGTNPRLVHLQTTTPHQCAAAAQTRQPLQDKVGRAARSRRCLAPPIHLVDVVVVGEWDIATEISLSPPDTQRRASVSLDQLFDVCVIVGVMDFGEMSVL